MFQRVALMTVLTFDFGMVLPASPDSLTATQTILARFADKTHEGTVVSVTAGANGADGKLVMTDRDGKQEHSHSIASAVKITLDKKDAVLTDLKKGDRVKVTTEAKGKVTGIEATREQI